MNTKFCMWLLSVLALMQVSFASPQDQSVFESRRNFFQQPVWKISNGDFENVETFCGASVEAVQRGHLPEVFDLSHHPVSSAQIELLTPVLQCASLTSLCFKECELDSESGMILLQALKGHPVLTHLDLSSNEIKEHAFSFMEDVFTKDSPLKVLNISDNPLGFEAARFLSGLIASGVCLEELNLANSELDHRSVSVLSAGILKSSTLKNLDISGNKMGELGGATLRGILTAGCSLKVLNAPYEEIGALGRRRILLGLQANIALPPERRLSSFRDTPLTQEFIESLKKREEAFLNLKKVHSFSELNFSHLALNDVALLEILTAVFSEESIVEVLNLSNNRISDAGALQIVSNMTKKKLRVDLRRNTLTNLGKEFLSNYCATPIVHEEKTGDCFLEIPVVPKSKKNIKKIINAISSSSGSSSHGIESSASSENNSVDEIREGTASAGRETTSVLVF